MFRYIFPVRLRQWLGPLIVAGVAGGSLAILIVVSGIVDLSAAKPHPEGWARLLHYTFRRSTAHHADEVPPADLDSPLRVAAGAAYYGQVCAHCHGGPGLGQNPVVLSMHPRPQYLVTDLPAQDAEFTPGELFRIVKAGVKYSAMPSWPADGRDDEVWHLVAFLRAVPKMSPETFRSLAIVAPQPAAAGAEVRTSVAAPLGPRYALRNDDEPPRTSFAYRYPTFGLSDVALAGDPVASCARCHGTDGAGGGAFPNLTIQDQGYLRRSLTAFANGQRHSGFMQVVASTLSPRQIEALASYYSALPRRATQATAPGSPLGQRIALVGLREAGLGACAGCHGVTSAAARAYPLLDGQARWYTADQLRVFKAGGRGGIEGRNPMTVIARRMTDAQIEAVAAYYAAQPPTKRQSFAAVAGTHRAGAPSSRSHGAAGQLAL